MALETQSLDLLELGLRMGLGLALGSLIGLERQWRQRMAGLRTNALVALGAAAYTAFSMLHPGEVSPTRVAAQVVSGIGFLGAGVIMREGVNVRGLNTAATLWCAAAVGVLAGSGYAWPALLTTALVLVANLGLRPLAQAIGASGSQEAEAEHAQVYRLGLDCSPAMELHLRALLLQELASGGLRLRRLAGRDLDAAQGLVRLDAELVSLDRAEDALERLARRFALEPGVRAVDWTRDAASDPS